MLKLEDPLNKVLETSRWDRPNGLDIFQKFQFHLGVIGIIYESRPNVTIDAGAVYALNQVILVILRGGSDSFHYIYTLLTKCFTTRFEK